MEYDRHGFVEAEDGTRLFWGLRGEASGRAAVVLNDGIGCDGFVWRYLQPHLAESRQVLHWHYRGHGRSGPPLDRERLDLPALAGDLRVVLDAAGIEQAVLIGHSMGTQVNLEAWRAMPERVAGMAFLCGSYGRVTHTFHGTDVLSQILPTVRTAARQYRGVARAIWGRVPTGLAYRMARLSGEVDAVTIREDDFRRYWEHIAVMDPDVFLQLLEAAGEHSAEDLLPDIGVPCLVLSAERDTFTPPELAAAMAEQIPGAELFVIRGGSHAAPVEQPMTVQLRVDKFLEERVDGDDPQPSARARG
ncbi:MAG TPA: alpha/beta hydrolase [Polyangiaceae bacterium LLY-WYZ-15_(1-7)]|nr:alpha/beta hydrolase [Myxococcales bacterium]MAT25507.1 alpha/beta hydrolase [Sandaracinus sp.]HJK94862.1 alpha/beta hydrolase [Polyangiaceae bacterium LLY-WYZ-15_(1-7)]MBJ72084.1 alpha/beta hydrolase [Sandaracinus sp.]HJL00357.1 alpha/beta hydrolase [Polyangiaceae bacterium LLY-WYZ-15_(1-7)]